MNKKFCWKNTLIPFAQIALLLLFIFPIRKFCEQKTDGFTLFRVHSDLSYNPNWAIDPPSLQEQSKIEAVLSLKFQYLGSGGQCYAFVSQDGQFVIKLFKHHLRRLPFWAIRWPLSSSYEKLIKRKQKERFSKLERDFDSYKLAYSELKDETGLLFIHLNKTDYLKKAVILIDKLGIEHALDLDSIEFVLQKKAELVYPHMNALMGQQDMEKAKEAIRSILSLIAERCQKGIVDEDPRIHRNFGFIGNQAVLIDVGRLKKDPQRTYFDVYHRDLIKITRRFQEWLQDHYPPLAPYLDEQIDAMQNNHQA